MLPDTKRIERRVLRFTAAWLLIFGSACGRGSSPLPADEARQTLRIDKGWRVELFASEPMFSDPVAMEIDEDGRIYVVQNSGYPLETEQGLGKVWLLEDTGGGKPGKSTLFADGLILPTGVMRWKKGILVTDAPNVWYLEDSNGDNKADVKRVVLTGFAFTNPQHTVNSPTYGLDNWIYLAHEGFTSAVVFTDKFGDEGSGIRFADRPEAPVVPTERRNVRFRPDRDQLETTSSSSQFGLTFDDYGRLIAANNSNHARQEVLAARYLTRNPDLLAESAMQDVSDHGTAAPVFSIARHPRFELLSGAGIFTSACGITWFRGGTFVAEPVHNLVHRDVWRSAGATFEASRSNEEVEFLASTDNWFRPVNFYVGPDDALYVVDYYRKVIEHPEWTSSEVYESRDIYDGSDLGRIYRVTPLGGQTGAPTARVRLSQAADEELVSHLEKPNIWWRRTAQRLLVDRRSDKSVQPLRRMALGGASPLGRLHALWTLEGLGRLDPIEIEKALGDANAGVRENAIVLAENHLGEPTLVDALLEMERDKNARVRFQLLATLGSVQLPAAAKVRRRLLDRDIEDRWVQLAALSASSDDALPALEAAIASRSSKTDGRANYFRQLGSVIGARGKPVELANVLRMAASMTGTDVDWWRASVLDGLASGLRSRDATLLPQPALLELYDGRADDVRRAALRLLEISGLPAGKNALLRKAEATALDRAQIANRRADAIHLLSLAQPEKPAAFYQELVDPSEPEDVQTAAVAALGKQEGIEIATFFLARWRSLTPAVRSEAGSALVSDPERFRLLLEAIGKGEVQAWSLPLRQRIQMQMHRDQALRERARALLVAKAGDREALVERYQKVLDKTDGDALRGRAIFRNACAKCHTFQGTGAAVGPDLATVRNRSRGSLLNDILIPSQSIAQTYEAYIVETLSGGTLEGVIGEQTPTTLTLVHEQGEKDVIPRSEIKRMRVSNISAMPEDVDKEVSPEQMADLIAYLKNTN